MLFRSILPLRKEPEYKATIPGKLFEYMASGNPILGIGQTDGAMASIIGSTKTGTVADWDDEKTISEFIDNCWQKFKSGSSETENDNISQYSRRALAGKMAALMYSLLRQEK